MKRAVCTLVLAVVATFSLSAQKSQLFETKTLKSDILKMDRHYSIYLPEGYNESDRSYPVLYLLHGSGDDHTGWVQFGEVQHIADKAIEEGVATKMIIVMPDANSGVKGYFNSTQGNFNYEDFFFKELIPHIEKNYRVRASRQYRAISGLSMGGGGTTYYALNHPDMFSAACPMSASMGSVNEADMQKRIDATLRQPNNKLTAEQLKTYYTKLSAGPLINSMGDEELSKVKKIRWYITCGDDDFLYEGNSLFHNLLRQKEIPHEYRVKDGGHTWTYWRMELPIVMEFISKSFTQF